MSQITKFFRVILTTCTFAVCFCVGTPSASFGETAQELESCISQAGNVDTAANCFQFKMSLKKDGGFNSFAFRFGAAGTFFIDCGADVNMIGGPYNSLGGADVSPIVIVDSNNNIVSSRRFWKIVHYSPGILGAYSAGGGIEYACAYSGVESSVTFGLAGSVGEGQNVVGNYSSGATVPAFAVGSSNGDTNSKSLVTGMSGSLGAVFPIISNNSTDKPKFVGTFSGCSNLGGYISTELFDGIQNGSFDMTDMFNDTGLATQCPSGTQLYKPNLPSVYYYSGTNVWSSKVACLAYDFQLQIEGTDMFYWSMSATGDFAIDCGDNGTLGYWPYGASLATSYGTGSQSVQRNSTVEELYFCKYGDGGQHTIRFSGTATGYNSDNTVPAIRFGVYSGFNEMSQNSNNSNYVQMLHGSLGKIFKTLSSGTYRVPSFYQTFYGCTKLQDEIPSNLFSYQENGTWKGVTGSRQKMFMSTFKDCWGITYLPDYLFGGITSHEDNMFNSTFMNCKGLSKIPKYLFTGFSGAATSMFESTFENCINIKTLPDYLFSGVSSHAEKMFKATFKGCSILTIIPSSLFTGFSGAATSMFESTFENDEVIDSIPSGLFSGTRNADSKMFYRTFANCTGMGGEIPGNLFGGEYRIGSAASMFKETFLNDAKLVNAIPDGLFGKLGNSAANSMFYSTFEGCINLGGDSNVPSALFSGLSGAESDMFRATFKNVSKITGIDTGLFDGLSGAAQFMFGETFYNTGVTSLPAGLFKGLRGIASSMFDSTFKNCAALSGPIPNDVENNNPFFGPLTKPANVSVEETKGMFYDMFYGCSKLGRNSNGNSAYYIPADLLRDIPYGAVPTMLNYTFKNTGLLECCPAGYRRLTASEANTTNMNEDYNMANFINIPTYYGHVVCTPGTVDGEAVLNPYDYSCNTILSCGKKLKTKMPGQDGAISEYLLLQASSNNSVSGMEQNLKIAIGGNTCFVPTKQQNSVQDGKLNIKKGNVNYHGLTVADLNPSVSQ